ncbi:hypothetical protein J6590_071323 [Homalodisca vitripennis]|nr:hypothetical protein J6590_071323 [Homalodisca vitripennis]
MIAFIPDAQCLHASLNKFFFQFISTLDSTIRYMMVMAFVDDQIWCLNAGVETHSTSHPAHTSPLKEFSSSYSNRRRNECFDCDPHNFQTHSRDASLHMMKLLHKGASRGKSRLMVVVKMLLKTIKADLAVEYHSSFADNDQSRSLLRQPSTSQAEVATLWTSKRSASDSRGERVKYPWSQQPSDVRPPAVSLACGSSRK